MTLNMGLDKMVNHITIDLAHDVERKYHMHRDSGMLLLFNTMSVLPNIYKDLDI